MPYNKLHPLRAADGKGGNYDLYLRPICSATKITLGYLFPGVQEWHKSYTAIPALQPKGHPSSLFSLFIFACSFYCQVLWQVVPSFSKATNNNLVHIINWALLLFLR